MAILSKVSKAKEVQMGSKIAGELHAMEPFRTAEYVGDDWYVRVHPAKHVKECLISDPFEPAFIMAVSVAKGALVKILRNHPVIVASVAKYEIEL